MNLTAFWSETQMVDPIDTLMVEVRAGTDGFRADIDNGLVTGFERAGSVLERGLLSAIRSGNLGFDDLKRIAFSTLNEIAAQALNMGIGSLFGAPGQASSGGIAGLFSTVVSTFLGMPGRATGGPVAPGKAYMVGERGPELFVPTAAGRVETGMPGGNGSRDVRVSINLAAPRGTDVPTALRRSQRQVASHVRRALQQF
jgi:phage-related minor tail protein